MKNLTRKYVLAGSLACLLGWASMSDAQPQDDPLPDVERPAETQAPAVPDVDPQPDADAEEQRQFRRGRRDNSIVSIGHDSFLPKGESADAVVSIFGSSTSEGEVFDAVVSFLGDSRVTGPVGDSVVAVFGNAYVNSSVRGDVVAILGTIELGPEAEIGGELVAVGGAISRDPQAAIRGGINDIVGGMQWLRPWIEHALFLGRPLALEPGLGWAWALALGFLALYVLIALLFRESVDQCTRTLDEQPGQSLLAALLAMLLTPVLMVLLLITVIGIAVVPFAALAIYVAILFGKAVMLAWIGGRFIRFFGHTAIAVLVGGVIVLGLYLVPVIGFIVYKLLGIVGFGVVIYTLLLKAKAARRVQALEAPAAHGVSSSDAPIDVSGVAGQATADMAAADPIAAASTMARAGFWIRMAALAIDAVLVGVVLSAFGDSDQTFLLVIAAYGAVMWKLKGTTVGGIVCGLQVVRLDGRAIDWPTAMVRALSCFLSLIVVGLGFLWIVFDDGKQSWHDKIAGTAVVRAPKGASLL